MCALALYLVVLTSAEAKGSICRRLRPLRLCVYLRRLAPHDVSACSSPFMEGVSYACLCCSCVPVSASAPAAARLAAAVVVVVV
jgi:hypothetical protein